MVARVAGSFPYGTLAVNISGALLLGLLAGLALSLRSRRLPAPRSSALHDVSDGCWETQRLGEERQLRPAVANIVVSLVLGLAAARLGLSIGGRL